MSFYYSKHHINKSDILHVTNSLHQSFLSQGKYKKKLEKLVKRIFNVKYCLAVSNCTSALHLSYLALGLKSNDYVITTPLTWSATVSSALNCGSRVKLIDIDSQTLNIDLNKLEVFLKKNKKKPKIIIPVHYGGSPVDLERLKEISSKYKIKIVEDAAHAMGSKFKKDLIGNCKYSDITVFSMQPAKPITSGEGGLILTNNKKIFETTSLLSKHGSVVSKKYPWTQNIKNLGFNYKLSELNCALAYSQLKRLFLINKRKEYLNSLYRKELSTIAGLSFQKILPGCISSNHLFTVLLPNTLNYKDKKKIFLTLKYMPIDCNTAYRKKVINKNSENFFKRAFNFPIYFSLTKKQLKFICNCFKSVLSEF